MIPAAPDDLDDIRPECYKTETDLAEASQKCWPFLCESQLSLASLMSLYFSITYFYV